MRNGELYSTPSLLPAPAEDTNSNKMQNTIMKLVTLPPGSNQEIHKREDPENTNKNEKETRDIHKIEYSERKGAEI